MENTESSRQFLSRIRIFSLEVKSGQRISEKLSEKLLLLRSRYSSDEEDTYDTRDSKEL